MIPNINHTQLSELFCVPRTTPDTPLEGTHGLARNCTERTPPCGARTEPHGLARNNRTAIGLSTQSRTHACQELRPRTGLQGIWGLPRTGSHGIARDPGSAPHGIARDRTGSGVCPSKLHAIPCAAGVRSCRSRPTESFQSETTRLASSDMNGC